MWQNILSSLSLDLVRCALKYMYPYHGVTMGNEISMETLAQLTGIEEIAYTLNGLKIRSSIMHSVKLIILPHFYIKIVVGVVSKGPLNVGGGGV